MVNVNRYGGVCNVKNPEKRVYRREVKCKGYKIAKMNVEEV